MITQVNICKALRTLLAKSKYYVIVRNCSINNMESFSSLFLIFPNSKM